MNDAKREILAKVASATLTPLQAAVELEELEAPSRSPEPVAARGPSDVRRVRVVASMGSVTIVGDESVREAVADGPHVATRQGDTFVIESEEDEDFLGFGFNTRVRFGFGSRDPKLLVRMNPTLLLDAQVQAGTLVVRGIRAPIKAEVQAGSTRLEDFSFPIDLDVQAGSVKAYGKLTEGKSRISCQAGSVKLELDPGSSVKINAKTSFGKVSLPDVPMVAGVGGARSQAQLGAGEATLDIDSELGSVQVGLGQ
jgi:hypothetical protein